MANIHGIGDYEANNNRNQRQQMMGGGGGGNGDGQQPDFIRGLFRTQDMNQDPRKETFLQMLYQTFCPTLTRYSFITMITIADSMIFLACVIASFAKGGLNN